MLRALVVALLLANLGFFAWTQGWIDPIVGVRSIGDREPERMARQVRPDLIRILSPAESARAASAASAAARSVQSAAPSCLEAGPYTDAELPVVRVALQAAAPELNLSAATVERTADWIVYIGPFAGRDALERRLDELKRRNLDAEEIREPAALEPGLSLGHFETRAAAAKALLAFAQQGVQTARIVERAAAAPGQWLRVTGADGDTAARLAASSGATLGKSFVPCNRAPAR